ncbi:MFS transporter [Gordonia rhizosphera]|uniref:Putative major facilitator superfamily transporter n=1 Tax=Gordonia rhizosphera NBRC 16068 TaxID=1108045 RepID=K6VSF7_9ACTN|nr:MFS transporter [Gordonia rhizosphera]GAB89805.1 putative major facilitator superfamily transporter [Gordonia rhizosphera NBRC 16068]
MALATPISQGRQLNRWWYAATGFLTLLFGTTTVNVLFNVLGKPMADDLGWDRSVITNGFSIETLLVGVSIVALGILVDRYGPKLPSVPMAMGFGVGLMLMAALPANQAIFYLLCVLIGLSAGAVNPIAHATVVSAWFVDRRGLALGFLMAGLGACGVMMPYLANWIFDFAGWRGTFLIIGALCTVIPAGVYAFVTKMPHEHEKERLAARAAGRTAGQSLWALARTSRQFWLLSGSIFLVSSATFGLMSQVVPMTTDKGIDKSAAIAALSLLSLSSVGARVLVGYALDRFFAPMIGAIIFALCGVGVILLISSSGTAALMGGALLVGLALGAEGDVAAYITSRYFPKHSYARVLGFIYFLYAMGASFGIFLLGQVYSATGSYNAGIVPIVGMVVASIACLLAMGSYRYSLDHREVSESVETAVAAEGATAV